MLNQIEVLLRVAGLLEEMRIPYIVVGSVASSLQGFSRATADVDMVADLRPEHVAPFFAALKDEYYVDDQAMRRAVSLRRMFNLIHLDTLIKVDIYVPKDETAELLFDLERGVVVADEFHKFGLGADRNTLFARALAALRNNAQRAFPLSGTPTGGKPIRLFGPLNFIDPDTFSSKWRWAWTSLPTGPLI